MKGSRIHYTADELAWIEANATRIRSEAHSEFQARFARPDVSFQNYNALCKRKGWMTGRTGCFVKGQEPPNKGKPMPDHIKAKCAKTQFKKGNLPHNARGHGHERIDAKDGYVVMIIDEVNPWSGAKTRPVHKHRYLWEREYGPVPEGYALKCLDGDKTNCDPSNWELIPRGVLPRLNGGNRHRKRLRFDDAAPEVKPTLMAIAKLEYAAREATKKANS